MDKSARQIGRKMLAIYQETASELQETISKGAPTTCTKGCTSCCSLQVYISLPEAVAIAERISNYPALLKEVVQSCEEQIAKQLPNQSEHFKQNIPCVFLSKAGECRVYDVRPMPCRHHYAVTPPENCSPDNQDQDVGRYDTTEIDRKVMMTSVRESKRHNLPPLVAPIPVAVMWALRLLEAGPVKFLTLLETQENLGLADIRFWTRLALLGNEQSEEPNEQPEIPPAI